MSNAVETAAKNLASKMSDADVAIMQQIVAAMRQEGDAPELSVEEWERFESLFDGLPN